MACPPPTGLASVLLLLLLSHQLTVLKRKEIAPAPLDESVAAHLCPPTAIGWKTRASHPSKPCICTCWTCILRRAEAVSTSHKTLLISHLGCLGIRVNFAKSILSRSQRVSFLGTVIDCLSGASHDDSSPRGFLQRTKRAHFSTTLLQMLRRHCKTCRTPLHAAWVAYQYKVLPFGPSLAPHTFTRCMDAAFSPLQYNTN